jgi:hypothetical protein
MGGGGGGGGGGEGATEMVALKKVKDENSWQYIDLEKKGKCLPAIT